VSEHGRQPAGFAGWVVFCLGVLLQLYALGSESVLRMLLLLGVGFLLEGVSGVWDDTPPAQLKSPLRMLRDIRRRVETWDRRA